MGNGAGILSVEEDASPSPGLAYADVEKKVKSDYYVRQYNSMNSLSSGDNAARVSATPSGSSEYEHALYRAIRAEALDIIEALIRVAFFRSGSGSRSSRSSSSRKVSAPIVLPLHLAARMCKVEACELLCSAGYDLFARDPMFGQTPLHLTGYSCSIDAALCASLLVHSAGPQLVRSREERSGHTILHICCSTNNGIVLQAVLNYLFSLGTASTRSRSSSIDVGHIIDSPNNNGETALDVAKRNRYCSLYDYFNAKSPIYSAEGASIAYRSSAQAAVDMDRIIKVWESFFDNAVKAKECRLARHRKDVSPPELDAAKAVRGDWFQWFLLAYNNGGEELDYYVLNLGTSETRTLKTHLQEMCFDYNSRASGKHYTAPSTVGECAADGWFQYYDYSYNYCYFMNIVSGRLEHCLPVAYDTRGVVRFDLRSSPSEQNSPLLYCEQAALVRAWVVVDDTAASSGGSLYYWNRSTNHTTYDKPYGYDDIVASSGGWALYCSAESGNVPYWSHSETGESRWEQ